MRGRLTLLVSVAVMSASVAIGACGAFSGSDTTAPIDASADAPNGDATASGDGSTLPLDGSAISDGGAGSSDAGGEVCTSFTTSDPSGGFLTLNNVMTSATGVTVALSNGDQFIQGSFPEPTAITKTTLVMTGTFTVGTTGWNVGAYEDLVYVALMDKGGGSELGAAGLVLASSGLDVNAYPPASSNTADNAIAAADLGTATGDIVFEIDWRTGALRLGFFGASTTKSLRLTADGGAPGLDVDVRIGGATSPTPNPKFQLLLTRACVRNE